LADLAAFDTEFTKRLKDERLLLVSEIYDLGKRHGLSESQVERIIGQAETSGLGFREVAFVYLEQEHDGQGH
jgi:hypothetical protein